MRHISLFLAAALALPAHAQDDEHLATPPHVPTAAPWLTGADLLRKLSSPADTGAAVDYLQGVYDATERREWCHVGPNWQHLARPRPLELAAQIRAALAQLPTAQLKRSAGALVLEIWQDKWPCPSVEGSGCCP
jgi:hypothetical protein